MSSEIYVTPTELAERCGIHRNAVYNAMYHGRLPYVKLYGKRLISQAAASHYEQQQGVRNGARTKKGDPK